jgi:hypothetical protein
MTDFPPDVCNDIPRCPLMLIFSSPSHPFIGKASAVFEDARPIFADVHVSLQEYGN